MSVETSWSQRFVYRAEFKAWRLVEDHADVCEDCDLEKWPPFHCEVGMSLAMAWHATLPAVVREIQKTRREAKAAVKAMKLAA